MLTIDDYILIEELKSIQESIYDGNYGRANDKLDYLITAIEEKC